jgi:hypothetical protein
MPWATSLSHPDLARLLKVVPECWNEYVDVNKQLRFWVLIYCNTFDIFLTITFWADTILHDLGELSKDKNRQSAR